MTDEHQAKPQIAKILDSGIVACLFLFVVAAPHSIAGTQIAWLIGMLFWLVRFAFRPRPKLFRTPVDYYLLSFFILTGLSAFLSYQPMVSIGKLRAASLFTIVYLFAENIPTLKIARLLAITLIASCMLNVFYTAGERVIGRGVKVAGVMQQSPLYRAGIRDGDTLLKVDGHRLRDPQELVDALSKPGYSSEVVIYRYEWQPTFKVSRGILLPGANALEQLGVENWTSGRDWRASGFYGHYVTYAEVLQLIVALALGMFLSLPNKRSLAGGLLLASLAGLLLALALTVTRAPWLGCLVSTVLILLLSVPRRRLVLIGALAIPLVLAGLFLLQQKRNVGFIDRADGSTTWRETVWREGAALVVSSPRHLLVGVGMDSIKSHWRQWGLFDGGRIPIGHMHSNLLQIALERGVPALLLWLALLFVYAKTLGRSLRDAAKLKWMYRGIVLGALGGLAGFFTSGLVHYNWGDSEVVTVFYLIMGLALAIHREIHRASQTP